MGSRIGILFLVFGLVCSRAAHAQVDYSRLPDDPRKLARLVNQAKTGLGAAIKIAEDVTKGRACHAEMKEQAGRFIVNVQIAGQDRMFTVVVDPASGSVIERKETPMTAPVLPGDPVSGEPKTTASGLQYYDIKAGNGETPSGPTAPVTVHYSGWLVDGRKFDSSVDRGQPVTLDLNQFIRGWSEGVGSMKVGGKRKLIIPYNLAYGESGRPPVIPPKALLIFDVELLAVAK